MDKQFLTAVRGLLLQVEFLTQCSTYLSSQQRECWPGLIDKAKTLRKLLEDLPADPAAAPAITTQLKGNPSDWALQVAAQAWCEPESQYSVMDPRVAVAFGRLLDRYLNDQQTISLVAQTLAGKMDEVDAAAYGQIGLDQMAVAVLQAMRDRP